MVFDATARAFNHSESAGGRSPRASTSATVLPAPPGSTHSVKRRRTTQPGTASSTPTPSPAPTPIIDLDALDAARRRAAGRVMSLWESLAEKYARPIEEDDEIDILTGKICRDRGVLRSVSERGWKIGSFGEALEVEPLVLVSEGETETGASEADDEGEGEDDTEGEGVEGTEEGEEDPLGTWAYDWQYRVLPPPRPELSPQDAEDLKEFLAAENAIQENIRKNGKQPEPEDDDIVYLGDSFHNTDGTLRTDETSDDEFASMAITDSSTIRYMKHEDDDDEVDDVEPMTSILGALALGRTPKKQFPRPSSSQPKDEEMNNKCLPVSNSSQNNAPGRSYPNGGPPTSAIRSPAGTSSIGGISELGVEDDIIVIDSDSDDEPSNKPGIPSSSPSKPIELSAGASNSTPTQRVSSGALVPNPVSVSSIRSHSPVNRSTRTPKVLLTGTTTLLKPSAIQQSPLSTKRVPTLPGPPVYPATTKGRSPKPVLGESPPRFRTGSKTTTTNGHQDDAPHSCSAAITARTPTKKGPNHIPATESPTKSPNKQTHEIEVPVKTAKRRATTPDTGIKEKQALSQGMTACPGPPSKVDFPSPKVPKSASTTSPPSSARSSSPAKRRKKATVVEVVLPAPRKTSKVKRESTAPPAHTVSKNTALATSATSLNERSYLKPGGPAPSSGQPNSTPETTHTIPHTSLVVRSGVRPGLKRKRSLDGAELTEGAGYALESRINAGSVGPEPGPLHAYCPSAPMGRNQPAACCPAHLHAHTPHLAHTSCSTHHHLGIPVYQHQHQHQHLHTHLPYPLPQLPYTANELTEAAFKLIHGLSTFHQVSGTSGSSGNGFWLPGAQPPFGFAIPGQAGPSSQALAPKLEEPSSQEKIPNEYVPSSQEHERKAEATNIPVDEKPNQIPPPLPQLEDPAPAVLDPSFETHMENQTATASGVTLSSPCNLKLPPPEREMSVIDIESDSDDELAVCDAGAGSIRWEPPVKKEVDPGVERGSERQPSPKKSSVTGRASSRTSPIKLKRMP
ncbi:unnamed protein product [Rhizoctonia solani]|uniref:Uncharacterized protein n=1 Tax=Rhizoctonia solani TaxID=456999 RepID=A0A8H3DJV0_9AGAM|nr:unnamed protein product [Rhizoctonia solani]